MRYEFPGIDVDIFEEVALIRLQAHAYEIDALESISDAVGALERDDSIAAIILAGTTQTFWLGASARLLRHMSALTRADLLELIRRGQRNVTALVSSSKLTVAYLEGFAAGGGVDLLLACDLVLVGDSARVNLFYSKLGVVPDQGGLFLLAERVGWRAAVQMAASSPTWKSDDLLAMGLAVRKVDASMDVKQLRHALRKELRVPSSTRAVLKQVRWSHLRATFLEHLDAVAVGMSELLGLSEQQALISQMEAMQRVKGSA